MNKIILTIAVGCFSIAHSQNLNFTDAKFKALLLSSSPANQIAKDLNGNAIAIDANGDGEIQVAEAEQVKVLNIKLNGTPTLNKLPDQIIDATLFTNMEELFIHDTKSAVISFVNNSKIKKILFTGSETYTDSTGTAQEIPIKYSFDNCSAVHDVNQFLVNLNTYYLIQPAGVKLTFKNCPQLNGDILISGKAIKEISIENCNITTFRAISCFTLKKVQLPNINSLTKITLEGYTGEPYNNLGQHIDLTVNDCINLQEITTDADHYYSTGLYIGYINVNGCTNLKKIKGLNTPSIDFTIAGLTNLEELDCAYYNRYIYTGHQDGFVYFGKVTTLNLAGLPKLKVLKAFNQPITNDVNFSTATALENIDITNSCASMNTVNVSNLTNLNTLKTNTIDSAGTNVNSNLQKITAKNCNSLTNFVFNGNGHLKELDLQNCPSLQRIAIGYYVQESDGIFPELNSINLLQCPGIKEIIIHNTEINTLNVSQCSSLKTLELQGDNLLSSIDISNNLNLESLTLQSLSLISQLNTLNNINLKSAFISNCPQITQLNFSTATNFEGLSFWNMPNLNYVNLRNGSIEEFNDYSGYSTNLHMCIDDAQLSDLQLLYPDITFTTNCGNFLSTNNSQIKNKIQIAPNPVKDFVMIKAEENIKNVKIFDVQGKMTFHQDLNHEMMKINLSDYPTGTYIIKIKTDNTEISKKIIKK
ncbi:T9SS type A sorting domain-containing protein [Chryseobacterium sp. MMS23-Vi53]|uniref:T9SS type A sorting domain-containing protein n=1 Tax=Chryseobacterium sp. MMS23-Vi53 TaxID=3386644 RepID=UPI0039E90DAB